MMEMCSRFVLLTCLVALAVALSAQAEDERADGTLSDRPTTASGMRVFVDPESGEIISKPLEVESPGARLSGFSDDEVELVEEVNPAGGYTIDLGRRFGAAARARATAEGVEVECTTDRAATR